MSLRALRRRAKHELLCLTLSTLGCTASPSLGLATSGPQALDVVPTTTASASSSDAKRARSELHWGGRWCFDTGAPVSAAPALGPGGEAYVATHEGYVHALNSSGRFAWSYTVKGAILGGPVVHSDGTVLVATSLNLLYALKPEGSRLWVFRVPETIGSPLALSERGTVLFTAGQRFVYAVSSRGGVVWRVALGSKATTGPRVHEDGRVFIGTIKGVETWVAPLQRSLWASPPVDGFVSGPTNGAAEQHWLASGRMFSSNGPVSRATSLIFAHRSSDGSTLAVTPSRLLELAPDGTERRGVPLEVQPSAPPVQVQPQEVFVPLVDGTIARVREWRSVETYAKLGFSPVSSLVVDPKRSQLLASVGEGRVCAVSLSRGSSAVSP